jgi:CheY-like chemotaxis protein
LLDRCPHFLLAEDDPNQVQLIRLALEDSEQAFTLDDVGDGAEALAYLKNEGAYADRPRPDAVLLDLNMPKMGGHEVLETVKTDAKLKTIPVVILTTSTNEEDRARAYKNHANSYLVKPTDFDAYESLVRGLEVYWGRFNTSPNA